MAHHDIHVFMQQQAAEMASEYDRIFARASEDPGTAGDEGEQSWANFLRNWLPEGYHVETKGRLIGADGELSPQIDIVILKPSYPVSARKRKIWLADGVAGAFECKTTLRSSHVTASVERAPQFKDRMTPRSGSPYKELRSPLIYGLLAHSHSWKSPGSKPVDNIVENLNINSINSRHPRDLIDFLCVADLATISLMAVTRFECRAAANPEFYRENFGGPWGPITSFNSGAFHSPSQTAHFQPVGSLIAGIWVRLAEEDPALRPLASYYIRAKMLGTSTGLMRPWPSTIYSEAVRRKIDMGCGSFDEWDEWATSFL